MRSIKLPSWHKTGFASNVNDLLSRVGIITRPLGFATRGYLHSALCSLRTSHSFGRPDLASELPLVPRVISTWSVNCKSFCCQVHYNNPANISWNHSWVQQHFSNWNTAQSAVFVVHGSDWQVNHKVQAKWHLLFWEWTRLFKSFFSWLQVHFEMSALRMLVWISLFSWSMHKSIFYCDVQHYMAGK